MDETDRVWIMLHSGSRGIGNAIGMYFIGLAKEDMRGWFINLPDEKVYMNIASYGNTSAASIPIALTDALEEGRIASGDLVVFVAFGSGLTSGAATVRWGERTTPLGTSDARLPDTDQTGAELMLAVQERRRARRGG